jgi:endonuclease YncB( thermonuclease family)
MTQSSRHGSVLLLAIVLALSGSKGEAPVDAQGRGKLTGIVTHVADGDTLDITANGQAYTIRLDGIDAPERGQAFGQQAGQHLRVLAFSQPATALVQDRDRYGRTVARVIVAGRDLSEEMVKACRARTGGQAAASWVVGRSIRPAALAVLFHGRVNPR